MDFDELFALESIDQIVGNTPAMRSLAEYCIEVEKGGSPKPLMVYGPSGVGKSAAARLLAKSKGWNIVEKNASDYRDKDSISKLIASAATSRNLFGSRNVIIMDEIDELNAKFDKGAQAAISELVTKSKNPIIFIANDMWDQSISFLRGKTTPVQFKKLAKPEVALALKNLKARHKLDISDDFIEAIASRSEGDVRSAINDTIALLGARSENAMDSIGTRDKKYDIFKVLDSIFFSNTVAMPMKSISSSDVSMDMLINWIEENIPRRYYAQDMPGAFECLSKASEYLSKATRKQYYTYWRYASALMGSGVALSKSSYPKNFQRYEFPKSIKYLSQSRQERQSSSKVIAKLQRKIKTNRRTIRAVYLPLISSILSNEIKSGAKKSAVVESAMRTFGLDDKEAESLVAA